MPETSYIEQLEANKKHLAEALARGIEAGRKAIPILREEANRASHIETQEYIDQVCAAADALEKFLGIAAST